MEIRIPGCMLEEPDCKHKQCAKCGWYYREQQRRQQEMEDFGLEKGKDGIHRLQIHKYDQKTNKTR